jgi:undecaprenyl-phosphate alpha-N-acetylglucosaminyl 1-phosphatetransferase/UDP-N-acetylglucosamine 2-epimerase
MDDAKLVAASAISLAVTLFALFSMRPVARRLGLVDRPDDRKRHRGRVPLVGGLCFFLGTVVGLVYLGYVDRFVASLLVPCALIVMTGMVDDLHDLSVRSRLIIQTCAAGMVIAASGVYLDHTGQIFGSHGIELGVVGIPITIIAVIGLINAFNMLDGIDGLAASLAMVSIGAILLFGDASLPVLGVTLLLQVLFSSLIPYLCVNMGWPDGRKVFMGDAGSTLIGFLLAWSLVFLSHRGVDRIAPVDALWCVALPVMDTLAVMVRRMRNGMSPFKPDRQHLHHLLQDTGCTPRVTLACIVVGAGVLALVGYALRNVSETVSLLVFVTVMALYVLRFQRLLEVVCKHLQVRGEDAVHAPRAPTVLSLAGKARPTLVASPSHGGVLKALCVMATPPDAIRLAPIIEELSRDARFETRVCVAAQPDQTPEQVLSLFGIEADMHLEIASPGQDPADIASRALGGIKRVLNDFKPDVVLVPGNTSTTLATTLAAFYQQIPVVSIEPGGAQSRPASDRLDDANRKVTRTLASLHFTPSQSAGERLQAQGVPAERIVVSGNTAMGTLRTAAERIRQDAILEGHLGQCFAFLREGSPLLLMADRESMQFGNSDGKPSDQEFPVLHRRRASDMPVNDAFGPICHALMAVANRRPDVDIVYPIDERTVSLAEVKERMRECPNVHLIAPTDYLSFAYLLNHASAILADSSDLAFEVAAFGKPVLLVQEQSGVSPAIDAGNVSRVGVQQHAIAASLLALLANRSDADKLVGSRTTQRDASQRIADALANLRHLPQLPATNRLMPPVQIRPQVGEGLREAS